VYENNLSTMLEALYIVKGVISLYFLEDWRKRKLKHIRRGDVFPSETRHPSLEQTKQHECTLAGKGGNIRQPMNVR